VKKILFAFLATIIAISGCISQKDSDLATATCIEKCREVLNVGEDLSNGPCLSNEIIKDWVCDVAHSPRQTVDNLPQNQCSSYRITAMHFVEVDPQCNLIKIV